MKKIKTVHLHSDTKFLYDSARFEGEEFDNTLVLIKKELSYADFFEYRNLKIVEKQELGKILQYCRGADLVVLYDLDFIKSRVALALPKRVKIAWRFFGYELYSRNREQYFSQTTREALREQETGQKPNSRLPSFLRVPYHYFKYGGKPQHVFPRAIGRIDYMMLLCREEYDFLSRHWPNLPEFVMLSRRKRSREETLPSHEFKNLSRRKIILGNSRNAYNNHLDVIELIEKSSNRAAYEFTLLFNYGPEDEYTREVREAVRGKPYFNLIDEFIPPEEFTGFYRQVSALVINSYRQMAGANIFFGFANGVKIYLNRRNVLRDWLVNEGFHIGSLEDLEHDLEMDNLYLQPAAAEHNFKQLQKITEKYSPAEFRRDLLSRLLRNEEPQRSLVQDQSSTRESLTGQDLPSPPTLP